MNEKYKLDENNNPVLCEDLFEWARWYETAKRSVARDEIGGQIVSTIFLGLDYRGLLIDVDEPGPILWETMVFPRLDIQERYSSHKSAIKGHKRICDEVRHSLAV